MSEQGDERADRAIEASQLYSIFQHVPAIVGVVVAPDQRYVLANPGLRALYGNRPLLGRTRREAHPELHGHAVEELVDGVFRTGERAARNEVRVLIDRHNDGQRLEGFFNVIYEPIKDASGEVESVVLFAVEVTEQVRARQSAEQDRLARAESVAERNRADEERESFFQLAPDLFCIASVDGYFKRVNPAFPRALGWTEEELYAGSFLALVHPEDRAATLAALQQIARGRPAAPLENRYLCKDGTYRWLSWTMAPVKGGELLLASARDVSGQKEIERSRDRSEEALRLLAAASDQFTQTLDYRATLSAVAGLAVPLFADWVLVDLLDDAGRWERVAAVHADPAQAALAEEILAYPPSDDDRPSAQALRSNEVILVPEGLEEMLVQTATDPRQLRIARAMRLRSIIVVPLFARGRRLGLLSFCLAVTSTRRYGPPDRDLATELGRRAAVAIDNARLFEAAERERRRAEEANRAKDEFLAVVSHELRTPLTAILGYANLLRAGTGSGQMRERALEVIDRNARTQAQLINDLLDVSRIITGKLRLNVQSADLHAVLEGALESMQPAAAAKDVRISRVLDPHAGPISGDPERLQQVVWNLLANAVKFTPKGGKISVELLRINSHVEIVISDSGPGIPADFLPHVFERFRQADASSSRQHGGLGLGLSIVKHLVELHGGQVEAQSKGPGQGATFIVKLPVAPLRSERPAAVNVHPTVSAPVAFTEPPELKGARILLVEDEEDSRVLISSLLEACHAQVTSVSTAADGLAALDGAVFDVLLSDIGLPGKDGYAFIREVRQRPAGKGGRIPAIALTAYARTEDRTRALVSGFTMHLAKPIEPAELVVVVASLLRRDG